MPKPAPITGASPRRRAAGNHVQLLSREHGDRAGLQNGARRGRVSAGVHGNPRTFRALHSHTVARDSRRGNRGDRGAAG